jgi:hypothetical protein
MTRWGETSVAPTVAVNSGGAKEEHHDHDHIDHRRRSRGSLVGNVLSSLVSSDSNSPESEPEPVHVVSDPRRKSRGGLVFAALSHSPKPHVKDRRGSYDSDGKGTQDRRACNPAYDPRQAKKSTQTVAQTKQPSLPRKIWSKLTACFSSSSTQHDAGHITEVAVQQARTHSDNGSDSPADATKPGSADCLRTE